MQLKRQELRAIRNVRDNTENEFMSLIRNMQCARPIPQEQLESVVSKMREQRNDYYVKDVECELLEMELDNQGAQMEDSERRFYSAYYNSKLGWSSHGLDQDLSTTAEQLDEYEQTQLYHFITLDNSKSTKYRQPEHCPFYHMVSPSESLLDYHIQKHSWWTETWNELFPEQPESWTASREDAIWVGRHSNIHGFLGSSQEVDLMNLMKCLRHNLFSHIGKAAITVTAFSTILVPLTVAALDVGRMSELAARITAHGLTLGGSVVIPVFRLTEDIDIRWRIAGYATWGVSFTTVFVMAVVHQERGLRRKLLACLVVMSGFHLLGFLGQNLSTVDSMTIWGPLALTLSIYLIPVLMEANIDPMRLEENLPGDGNA
jgi:hypothetical protein